MNDLQGEFDDAMKRLAKEAQTSPPWTRPKEAPAPTNSGKHPLVGMYVHTFVTEKDGAKYAEYIGDIKYTGAILDVKDGIAFVQLFSAMDGCPTNVVLMSLAELQQGRIYRTRQDMLYGHWKECVRKGDPVGHFEEYLDVDRRWREALR